MQDTFPSPPGENKIPERKATAIEKTFLRIKRRVLARHLKEARLLLALAVLLVLGATIWFLFSFIKSSPIGQYASYARIFLSPTSGQIQSQEGRTNILVLGKAGEGHTAPDLTDTIMVASISHTSKKITMISLPRDIWIPALRAKLNSAYYWGNSKQENGGIILAKSSVEEIIGIPIHYAVVVDFNGFVGLIDAVGGIDVEITKSFEDNRYPLPGKENDECGGDPEFACRYETIVFNQGVEHMNGERALKYVRSRHSEDKEEGTDIARAQRQQKVIQALKKKMLSKEIILSPKKLSSIYKAGMEMVETDIVEESIVVLGRRGFDARESITTFVLPEEYLINPPISTKYDRQYVFIPKGETWQEVQAWVKSVLP